MVSRQRRFVSDLRHSLRVGSFTAAPGNDHNCTVCPTYGRIALHHILVDALRGDEREVLAAQRRHFIRVRPLM